MASDTTDSVPADVMDKGSEKDRRFSLTAYNIESDVSARPGDRDEHRDNPRVRFASMPTLEIGGVGSSQPYRKKYAVALQNLKPFRPSSRDGKIPINSVGFLSYIFISWMTSLVMKLYRKREEPVAESDIWECSDAEGLRVNTERLLRLWRKHLEDKGPNKASFSRVWLQFIQTRLAVSMAMLTLMALAAFFSSAFLLKLVISYIETPGTAVGYGLGLVAAVLACEVTRSLSFANLLVFSAQTATRFRSGFMGIMYDKLLRLRTVKGKTNSEILNVFSVDSYRVYMSSIVFCLLLAVPIYLAIGTVYCYYLIGPWCFVSIGIFIICYGAQMLLTKAIEVLRKECTKYTDERVRKMGEILNNMKFIKMYAWEEPFVSAIKGVRQSEQKYLLYSALTNAIIGSIIPVTPTIASVVTIAIYTSVGNDLSASTAFAVIGTMNFLRVIVSSIPIALRAYAEAKVSFKRIKRLLLLDEYAEPSWECFNKNLAVEIKSANFSWESLAEQEQIVLSKEKNHSKQRKSSVASMYSVTESRRSSLNMFGLSDIEFEVETGKLVGICGSVGSGKSSLMSAVLGRRKFYMHRPWFQMPLMKGHLAVGGTVAYVPQQAWIFNASLKDNILFGKEYNVKRYMEVISACGLEPDLHMLADGDQTEIGERGANLSGGQKQRVNLARALYSDSDIYILDDPLSSVDVRVSKLIFHKCIRALLKGKTVLFVTHQLQYLKHCDTVFVMEHGTIIESGVHLELLANNGPYADMFRIFDGTTLKHNTPDSSGALLADVDQGARSVVNTEARSGTETTQTKGILNKAKERKKKGKLIFAEEASIGVIGFDTYRSYIRAAGGWAVATIVVFMYLMASGSLVFSDWWLSEWINSLTDLSGDNVTTTSVNLDGNDTFGNYTMESPCLNDGSNTTSVDIGCSSTTNSSAPKTIDDIVNHISYNTYFLVYILSLVGIILLQLLQGFAGAKASIVASNRIHNTAVDKVMHAPMSFFDSNPTGRILNRFSKDLDEGDVFIPQMSNSLLQILTLVILSFAMSAYVTPWVLVAIVPIAVVFYMMNKVSSVSTRQLKRLENISRSPLLSHVNATSQGLSTIVAYGEQGRFFDTCMSLGDVTSITVMLFNISMRWVGLRLDLTASMLTVATTLVLVLTKGYISPAAAGLVLALCGKAVFTMQLLMRLMNETEARFTSIERLDEYRTKLVMEQPRRDSRPAAPDWPSKGGLIFRDVVMRYRPDMDPVLRGVSFEIHPQEKIGIVGRTGAGKSSIAVALFRLVELKSGQIYVDGEDISKLHLTSIRSNISTIPQDPVLFAGTLRYTIDPYARYSDDDIWSALEKVHMKEKIIQLDERLDVVVEENGDNLSAGERQLICLARAVLRRSKILLLDEATANIDTTTDAMIQETIKRCFSDCTVITIAHRLNTVLHSDRIIVMDAGQVMECASPPELLANPNSFFNAMIAAQTVNTPSP